MKIIVKHILVSLIIVFTINSFDSIAQDNMVWTFDCNQQGWGELNHSMSFNSVHQLEAPLVNSGHIELHTPIGLDQGWLFGPGEPINADVYKYLHFSLSLENADQISDEGIGALLVLAQDAAHTLIMPTIAFTIFKGQHHYTIDLSGHTGWKGTKYIDRFHLPQGTQTDYDPAAAIFRLDWIALSDASDIIEPVQDTTQACIPIAPVLSSTVESVVFCNRASAKTSYTGSRVNGRFKCWEEGTTDTIIHSQNIDNEGVIYFSTYDLQLNTNYNYLIEVSNSEGADTSDIMQFTTESELAEDQPMNYWMTPSPFKLIENANDHLLDNDSWPEAGELAQVYKIHGATYRGGPNSEFYKYDLSKLLYTVNKQRMRLAYEDVIGGDQTGQEYANRIFEKIEEIASYGGKLEFFTWDGMFLHCINSHETSENFRTIEEGIEAVAEATKLVKDQYPEFEIIPLPNLPNWDVRDAEGNIVPHNAGDNASNIGVNSWMDLADLYFTKIQQKGVSINFSQIDHPYAYYLNGREQSAQRIGAFKDYCTANNTELIIIINESNVGSGTQTLQDANFKKGSLDFLDDLREDGLDPQYIDVESWYRWPQYLVPETKENSFSNVILDVGKKFLFEDNIVITTEGDVSKITGIGITLQLYVRYKDSGTVVDADWSVDDESIATIDESGLLTTYKWGTVLISATAKDGSGNFAHFTLTIIDPAEPDAIIITSEGNLTEINGIGITHQFYSLDSEDGDTIDAIWSVDNIRGASITENGLLTTLTTGTINVKATLKSNPEVFATLKIYITDNPADLSYASDMNRVIIYPNPASESISLNISNISGDLTLSIVDIKGRIMKAESQLQAGLNSISIAKMPKGIYFLYVTSVDQRKVYKLVKE